MQNWTKFVITVKRMELLSKIATCIRSKQWVIQDFPEGVPTPKVGVLTYYFTILFCRKLHKNETIWTLMGGGGRMASFVTLWIHQC